MTGISWLFFDIGSTLLDESAAYAFRFREIAEKAGVSYDEVCDMVLEFYKQNMKGDKEVMKLYGVPCPKWRSDYEKLYPDTERCLKTLHGRYNIGIIANQDFGTRERLEGHGLLRYIDIIAASAEEGIAKPDRRLFDIALERAGCSPYNAVMIGDRIDNDIIPAKTLGMKTIWVKQGFGRYQNVKDDSERADVTVNSLTELIDILA